MTTYPDRLAAHEKPPGSDAALDAGCTCPVLENRHGKGRRLDANDRPEFVMVVGCPIHCPLPEAP